MIQTEEDNQKDVPLSEQMSEHMDEEALRACRRDETVKAVVVLKPGMTATEQDIIAAASQHLASYQKPKSVDFVDSLPKAPTGKILKRSLRDPYWAKGDKKV